MTASPLDFDISVGEHDNDGAPGFQPLLFGGSAFYLEVQMIKLAAGGDGSFIGAAINQ
jgi:hypothetical protein